MILTMRSAALIVALLFLYAPSQAQEKESLTLEQCFQETLQQSESFAIQEETIRIAQAHYWQALGQVLPHFEMNASNRFQDTSEIESDNGVGSTFTRSSTPSVALTLRQPLFQGLREFRSLSIAQSEQKKNSLETERAEQLLFLDVAQAYYTVLELEKELEILESMRETLQKRAQELQERIRLGKSRQSESLNMESELASTEGEIEKMRGAAQAARDWLSFLRGKESSQKLADEFQTPARLPEIETYLSSLTSRPDLDAADHAVKLAQGELLYEKGARFPTVDVEGNYYLYRIGFYEEIDWDVLFSLNFPIFTGGETKGRILEAKSGLRQAQLTQQELLRRSDTEVRQHYHNLAASQSLEAALERAESHGAANYQAQAEEYRLGWVDNLDVLQALRDWQEKRRELNQAHYQTKLDYAQLKVATGEAP
jgi:outer membrane protein